MSPKGCPTPYLYHIPPHIWSQHQNVSQHAQHSTSNPLKVEAITLEFLPLMKVANIKLNYLLQFLNQL
jgi:hypothetical protein